MKRFTCLALVFFHLAIFDILTTWYGLREGLVEKNALLTGLGISFTSGLETSLAYLLWFTMTLSIRISLVFILFLAHRFLSKRFEKGVWIVYAVIIGLIAYNLYVLLYNLYFICMYD